MPNPPASCRTTAPTATIPRPARSPLLAALFLLSSLLAAQSLPPLEPRPTGTTASLRGLAALSAQVAWVSGTQGTILRTVDGGLTWSKSTPPGQEAADFRDIHAFSPTEALVLSIGPGDKSRLWHTADAGASWQPLATNLDPNGFWDAIAFFDRQNGLLLGDPTEGSFTLLRTADGGKTWSRLPTLPPANANEGAFAASGTCLLVQGRHAWFATGGPGGARLFHSADAGQSWSVSQSPLRHDVPEAGVFSLAAAQGQPLLLAGGHYRAMDARIGIFARSQDHGRTFQDLSSSGLGGYRSAIAYGPKRIAFGKKQPLYATGPTGSDFSLDAGLSWQPLLLAPPAPRSAAGFHSVQVAPDGAVWFSGSDGRVARLLPKP